VPPRAAKPDSIRGGGSGPVGTRAIQTRSSVSKVCTVQVVDVARGIDCGLMAVSTAGAALINPVTGAYDIEADFFGIKTVFFVMEPLKRIEGAKRPTPTQSTCLYYDHDNEASKCVCGLNCSQATKLKT
jgi:hypothetical protein